MESWHKVHFLLLLILEWSTVMSVKVGVFRKCFGSSKLQFGWGCPWIGVLVLSLFLLLLPCAAALISPNARELEILHWAISGFIPESLNLQGFSLCAMPTLPAGAGLVCSRLLWCLVASATDQCAKQGAISSKWMGCARRGSSPRAASAWLSWCRVSCRHRLMAAAPAAHQPRTGAHLSPGAPTRTQMAAGWHKVWHPCPSFILFERLQPSWSSWPAVVVVFLRCPSRKALCNGVARRVLMSWIREFHKKTKSSLLVQRVCQKNSFSSRYTEALLPHSHFDFH